jgi:uncharacterized protein with GYD domain
VEEVMDTRKRAKGVEKEKLEEAGKKFEFVVEEAAEKEVEEVMDTRKRAKGVEKEKLEEAGKKFEFVVEEAVEKK